MRELGNNPHSCLRSNVGKAVELLVMPHPSRKIGVSTGGFPSVKPYA
jgi:hypothetical protein